MSTMRFSTASQASLSFDSASEFNEIENDNNATLSKNLHSHTIAHLQNRERLPTNTTTRNHSVHRWYNFIAGFSPEFVYECVEALPKVRQGVLLDPFTGCGTAQVEAMKCGMESLGYEPHPIFSRIAKAKIACNNCSTDIPLLEETIKRGLERPIDINTIPHKPREYLTKLFSENVLASLLGARSALSQSLFATNELAFLVLSKLVEKTSHSQTDGIYKAPTSKKRAIDALKALDEICGMIEADTEALRAAKHNLAPSTIYLKSSEIMQEVSSDTVDLVVTSPPYLNNFDYAEMTRMHLYFWGFANSWGEITDLVRSKLIVNTTTALKGHKEGQLKYRDQLPKSICVEVDDLVVQLRSMRDIKAGKKEYDLLIYPYFTQMTRVLRESLRVMRPGGRFHMMVADAALYGVHVASPQMLAQILEEIGYHDVSVTKVRSRGERWILNKREGSKIGLGEFHIEASA